MNPTLVAEMSSPANDDFSPTMSADGLTIALQRNATSSDIIVGERVDRGSPFTPRPDLVALVNTAGQEIDPSLSPDGLQLYFSQWDVDPCDPVLHVASRPDRDSPFGVPIVIPGFEGRGDMFGVDASDDGLELIYTNCRCVIENCDMEVAQRNSVSEPFVPGRALGELNLGAAQMDWREGWAGLTHDRSTMFFVGSIPNSMTEIYLYSTTRPGLAESTLFTTPQRFTDLDVAASVTRDPEVGVDGTTFLVSSNRGGGTYDIWMYTRACL